MQISTRSFLILLAAYLIAVAALAYFPYAAIRETSNLQMQDEARAAEAAISATVHDIAPKAAINGSPLERAAILGHLRDVASKSRVIERVEIVGGDGRVLDLTGPTGEPFDTPSELFGTDRRPRLEHLSGGFLSVGRYVLDVPLLESGDAVGYVRVTLDSKRLEPIYERSRIRFFLLAFAGLAAVALLGTLLHVHLKSESDKITGALNLALAGSPVQARRREFSEVLRAVSELTGEVSRFRSQTRVQRRLSAMTEMSDIAIAVVGPGIELEYATPPARELFQLGDEGEGWDFVQTLLRGEIDDESAGRTIEIDLPGRSVLCQIHAIPRSRSFLLLFRDTSLLRSLETDLRVAAYARGLTRLYMGVAHDFKAPLNALMLNLELLKSSVDDPRDPDLVAGEQRRWIAVIEEEIVRLRKMIESLLSLSAPPREERELFDLKDLLNNVEALLQPQARQQKVTLDVVIAPDPAPVLGHRDRIKQAVLNVAINALEVMPDGGTLSLVLRRKRDTATIRISDTGPGIPSDIRDRIFNMHFTTKATGTGIGLYVARSIFAAEGGALELVSTSGDGTIFDVRLPLRSGTA